MKAFAFLATAVALLATPVKPVTPAPVPVAAPFVLVLSVGGEFEDGTTAVVGDVVMGTDGRVYMTFVSFPHSGLQVGCWYSEHDWFGYGTGGDWGPYDADYIVYSPLLRSWIRQTLTASGEQPVPNCSR